MKSYRPVKAKKLSEYSNEDLQPFGVLPDGFPELLPPGGEFAHWKVRRPFSYISRQGWLIPVGDNFLTDLASIPRVLRIFYGQDGKETTGAVIHDWMYQHRDTHKYSNILTGEMELCDRELADAILYDVCRLACCSPWRAWSIYRGVRMGGWWAWMGYAKPMDAKERAYYQS